MRCIVVHGGVPVFVQIPFKLENIIAGAGVDISKFEWCASAWESEGTRWTTHTHAYVRRY